MTGNEYNDKANLNHEYMIVYQDMLRYLSSKDHFPAGRKGYSRRYSGYGTGKSNARTQGRGGIWRLSEIL